MKNYIANESGGWATSAGYVKFSFSRSIHFGRLYTNGSGNSKGKEADLCEALRCLGQGLHCMEVSCLKLAALAIAEQLFRTSVLTRTTASWHLES